MTTTQKRQCRLTEEGLQKWSEHYINADPRQVFTIEYQAEDHFWIKLWRNQYCIVPLNGVKEVFWNEDLGEYV